MLGASATTSDADRGDSDVLLSESEGTSDAERPERDALLLDSMDTSDTDRAESDSLLGAVLPELRLSCRWSVAATSDAERGAWYGKLLRVSAVTSDSERAM